MLSGTLRENLLYGAPDATEDELHAVVRTARLDGLVAPAARGPADPGRPPRHQAVRRRTAAGRDRPGPAAPAPLLLLDEATSQLDAVNEAALRATIADVADPPPYW